MQIPGGILSQCTFPTVCAHVRGVCVCLREKMGAPCEQLQEIRRAPPHVQLLSLLPVCDLYT